MEEEKEEEAAAMPEAEVEVDVEEEEDLKQDENVLKEEEDQMYQINLKGGRGPIFTQEQERERDHKHGFGQYSFSRLLWHIFPFTVYFFKTAHTQPLTEAETTKTLYDICRMTPPSQN